MPIQAVPTIWPRIENYPGRPKAMAKGDKDDLCVSIVNNTDNDIESFTVVLELMNGKEKKIKGHQLLAGESQILDAAVTCDFENIEEYKASVTDVKYETP